MDYEQRKAKILTDFFNSGVLKVKTDGYFKGKLRFNRNTHLAEEMYLETLYQLAKYDAEKLVIAFDENPKSIEMIAVTILKRQLQHKKPKVKTGDTQNQYQPPLSPNNSFGTKLIFGSNYFSDDYVSPTDTYNESGDNIDYKGIPISDGDFFSDRNYTPDRVEEIFKRLTPDEIEFVTALWNGEKFYKRKPTNAYKEYRDYIYNKIKEMDLNKGLTPLEQIKAKLTMSENIIFDIMFSEDLSYRDKIKKLKFSEQQYLAKRRFLLKRIKSFNIQ